MLIVFFNSFSLRKFIFYVPIILFLLINLYTYGLLETYTSAERVGTILLRLQIWNNYISEYLNGNLLFGYGYGSSFFNAVSLKAANAHNQYVDILYEAGILGLLIFTYMIYTFFFKEIKTKKMQLFMFCLLVVSVTGEYILPNQSLESWSALLFFTLGLFNENKRSNTHL